jgi:hypothetical protein
MSAITVNEIGIFKCKFHELKLCKNPAYAMMTVSFEIQLGNELKDWNTIPNQKSLLIESSAMTKFAALTPNKIYHFRMACKFQRENNKGGKFYPAGISYEPIEVMGEAKMQDAA